MIELVEKKLKDLYDVEDYYLELLDRSNNETGEKYYTDMLNETKAKINVLKELLEESKLLEKC